MKYLRHITAIAFLIGIAAIEFALNASQPQAAAAQGPTPTNQTCLACHSNPDLVKQLPSGEPLSLYVDEKVMGASVHGQKQVACVQCHSNITGFPHPDFIVADRRDVTLRLYPQCKQCHAQEYSKSLDSVHAKALAGGDRNAAVCTDCHTSHAVMKPNEPRQHIPQTCAQCHSEVFDIYASSVHGSAVMNGDNPDVPTCIDCHGVHNIGDPTTAAFRLKSPEICAKCHTDKTRMAKYKISTNVVNTYVADFHGTTVELFEKQSPDAATNKPVCYDCHGIHNIRRPDDPSATVYKSNLLATCQQCHPDANEKTFTDSWMSHYDASAQKYPLVYYVNLFYTIFIPLVIGGMALFVALDIYRRVKERMARRAIESAKVD